MVVMGHYQGVIPFILLHYGPNFALTLKGQFTQMKKSIFQVELNLQKVLFFIHKGLESSTAETSAASPIQ